MRIAVTGSRDWNDQALLDVALIRYLRPGSHLHVGDARGADAMAWALAHTLAGVEATRYEADWQTHGKAAGPMRNRELLDESRAQLLVAFKWGHEGRGTDDCIKAACERHIPVLLIQHTGSGSEAK